jgi:IS5 family transposase
MKHCRNGSQRRCDGIGTSGNVNDVVPANGLLHGQEKTVFADSGYRGAHKRPTPSPA